MRWRIAFSLVGLGLLLGGTGPARAQSISGPAEAIDGDTLAFTGFRVRLFGIDAVEKAQTCTRGGAAWACGEDARSALSELVGGRQVACDGRETDIYGRLVAVCRVGNVDLGKAMVLSGLAVAMPDFAADYVETQARAQRLGLGLWNSVFDEPQSWRAAHPQAEPRLAQVAAASPAKPAVYRNGQDCTIKGNQSYRGDWIYYLPGQAYYAETRPEAWFCTEAQAIAAGYRPTRAQ